MSTRLWLTTAVLLCLSCSAVRPDAPRAGEGAQTTTASVADRSALRSDLHIHLTMDRAAKPVFKGSPGDELLAGSPGVILRNQIDAQTLSRHHLRLVLGSVWPPFRLRPGRTERDEALNQLLWLREFGQSTSGFAIARDAEHARRLLSNGHVVVVPAVEGGEGIGSPEDVDLFFAAGARAITLVHFTSNDLGGAAHGQVGRVAGYESDRLSENGLTDAGRAAVKRMIELGILIDVAHSSEKTIAEVLTLTEAAGVPVVFSHGAARSFSGTERNLSDEAAKRIAASGGLIGVTLYDGFLAGLPKEAEVPDHVHGSCDDVAAHWLHFAKLVGAENVTLGSDFNGFVTRPRPGGPCPEGVRHTGDLGDLYAALEKRGVPAASIDGGGERLLKLLEQVEAKADAGARARAARLKIPDPPGLAAPL